MSINILCNLSEVDLIVVDKTSHSSNYTRVEDTARENSVSISESCVFDVVYQYKVEFGDLIKVVSTSDRKVVARDEAFNSLFRFLCEKFPRIVVNHPFSSTRLVNYDGEKEFEEWTNALCEDLSAQPYIDNMIIKTPLSKEQRQVLHFNAARYGLRTKSYNSSSGQRLISLSHISNMWGIYFYLKNGGVSHRYQLLEA